MARLIGDPPSGSISFTLIAAAEAGPAPLGHLLDLASMLFGRVAYCRE
jgi:hypothetical protein